MFFKNRFFLYSQSLTKSSRMYVLYNKSSQFSNYIRRYSYLSTKCPHLFLCETLTDFFPKLSLDTIPTITPLVLDWFTWNLYRSFFINFSLARTTLISKFRFVLFLIKNREYLKACKKIHFRQCLFLRKNYFNLFVVHMIATLF